MKNKGKIVSMKTKRGGKVLPLSVCLTLKQNKNPSFFFKEMSRVVLPIHCSVKLIIPNLSVEMGISLWLDHTNSLYNTDELIVLICMLEGHMHHHKLFWAVLQLNSSAYADEEGIWRSLTNLITKSNNNFILLDISQHF